MSDWDDTAAATSPPMVYQIRVKGLLGPEWADWFGGLSVVPGENGETILVGQIADQAALYGVLRKVRDLGMPLLSVGCLVPGDTNGPNGIQDVAANTTGGHNGDKHKYR